MVRRPLAAAMPMLAVALAGCALPPWGGSLPPRRPLGARFATFRPHPQPPGARPGAQGPPGGIDEPDGDLTLRQALALALLHSPELAAYAWGVRQAEAELLAASMPPNPELEAEFENFAGSGEFRAARALETTVALSQLVELGGKRDKRMRLAEQDSKLAAWDYEAKRLEVLTAVTKQFIAVLAMQEKLALAREDRKRAEATLDVVAKRVTAGKAAPTEKAKASIELASGRIRAGRMGRELGAARHKLAAMWGAATPRFARAGGALDKLSEVPPLELLRPKLAQNPDVARWAAEVGQRRAALALEKAQAVPDVTVGVGYRHFRETEDNDRAMLVTVGVPLPVFDQNRGAVAKARFGALKAAADRCAAEAKARALLAEAYQALAAAHAEAVSLRDEILPAARSSFEAAEKSFGHGKTQYLDVLDAQRTLIETREQHIDALASYHQAVADLEGLIGEPLDPVRAAGPQTKEKTDETQK